MGVCGIRRTQVSGVGGSGARLGRPDFQIVRNQAAGRDFEP